MCHPANRHSDLLWDGETDAQSREGTYSGHRIGDSLFLKVCLACHLDVCGMVLLWAGGDYSPHLSVIPASLGPPDVNGSCVGQFQLTCPCLTHLECSMHPPAFPTRAFSQPRRAPLTLYWGILGAQKVGGCLVTPLGVNPSQ